MAFQGIVQLVYNVFLGAAVVCLGLAIVTPNWTVVSDQDGGEETKGLLASECTFFNNMKDKLANLTKGNTEAFRDVEGLKKCINFWDGMSSWEQFTLSMLVLAFMTGIAAFIYSCITCGLCFCQSVLAVILPILTLCAFTMSMAGTTAYISQQHTLQSLTGDVEGAATSPDVQAGIAAMKESLGYSAMMALVSVASFFVATILSMFVLLTAKHVG